MKKLINKIKATIKVLFNLPTVHYEYVGYGIILSVILIPFFLLSHTKKEKIRAILKECCSFVQIYLVVF